jgi:hypothetical protein
MYVNQDGVKNESQKIVCDSCRYNCKYGGSDYCIRYHHFLTVNTIQRNYCKEYAKRFVYRKRIVIL